jgi:hypothetical protein
MSGVIYLENPPVASVTTAKIVDANVTTAKLAGNSVTTAKILDANVTTDKIANASVTAPKLSGAQTGTAPVYGVRAWVNFNGTGTVAINASGNVSSITDRGVGAYTVNFTTALPSANYAVFGSVESGSGNNVVCQVSASGGTAPNGTQKSTSSCQIWALSNTGAFDFACVSVAFVG